MEKKFKKPVLVDCDGDLGRKWYVYFSVYDAEMDKMIPCKKYKGINKFKTVEERYKAGYKILDVWESKLSAGWHPVYDNELVYLSEIDYHNRSAKNIKRKGNKRFYDYLVSEWFREYVRPKQLAAKTIMDYKSKLRVFGQWLESEQLHNVDIYNINNSVVRLFFRYMSVDLKRNRRTLDDYAMVLKNFFTYVCGDKQPVHSLDLPSYVETSTNRPINERDRLIFMDELKKHPQVLLSVLMLSYCFIRPGEQRKMQMSWIDFHTQKIIVPAKFSKNKKHQSVIIPKVFYSLITEYFVLQNYPANFYVFGKGGMPGPIGLGKNTLRNRFNAIRDSLNMNVDYKLYSWKHTGAISASNQGVPLKHLQLQMRHEELGTTDKYLNRMVGFESDQIKNFSL